MRDSLINVGPLKDFSYGMRINADLTAAGIAKQSNYELVSSLVDSTPNLNAVNGGGLTCFFFAWRYALTNVLLNTKISYHLVVSLPFCITSGNPS